MRGSREFSAASPERAARAGARRPRGAASGAGTTEPCRPSGGAGAPRAPLETVSETPSRRFAIGRLRTPSLPVSLGADRAARQRLRVQQRRSMINKGGRLSSARCQPGGNAPGPAGQQHAPYPPPSPLLSRGCGKPAHSPAAVERGEVGGRGVGGRTCLPRRLRERLHARSADRAAGSSRRERNFCSDLKPQLLCLFISPAAVAGCQARRPCLLKTHFSCPAQSSTSLAALRCSVKIKRCKV